MSMSTHNFQTAIDQADFSYLVPLGETIIAQIEDASIALSEALQNGDINELNIQVYHATTLSDDIHTVIKFCRKRVTTPDYQQRNGIHLPLIDTVLINISLQLLFFNRLISDAITIKTSISHDYAKENQ